MSALVLAGILCVGASLPEDVFLKTSEQSFGYENLYALQDGKLWSKPNPRHNPPGSTWTLFEGAGLPFGKHASSFASDDRVESFATEGLMVVAASQRGRLYLWQPTLFSATEWQDKVGQPFAGELWLPPHRDWTFSMSVQVAPKKRRTPMHDIDSFYEDAAGNRVEFGFTATVYVLDPDGQRIRYWDTGLPSAFYKAFDTPERGRFVAERLSASGSTLFVVDKAGKMFTRMMDYEMNGACPGLRYTFEKKRQSSGEQILSLFEAERVLPLADWREQESIPLQGLAQMTTKISIHMTGKGNAARELRVQGRDEKGRWGYWWKPIFEAQWLFQETGEAYEPKLAVDPKAPRAVGAILDKTYAGALKQPGAADLPVELVGFDYYNTPATLRVHQGERSWEVTLHTFDAWSPTVEQREHPDLVGSPLGEPKLLLGTLEIPEALLNSVDPPTKALVDKYLRRFHHVHQAFAVSADDARVEIEARPLQRKGTGSFDYALRVPLSGAVTRQLTAEELKRYEATNFTHLVELAPLVLPQDGSLHGSDLPRIQEMLKRNEALLEEIQRRDRTERKSHLEAGTVSALASAVFVPFNLLSDTLQLSTYNTLAGGLALTGGAVFEQYAKMNLKRVISTPEDSKRACALLKERIKRYRALERRLNGSGGSHPPR